MGPLRWGTELLVKKLLVLPVVCLIISFLPAVGSTAVKIKIKPMINVGVGFDSNFYKTKDNEQAVLTYTAQPGIQLGFETAKTSVLLNYTLEGYIYQHHLDGDPPRDEKSGSDLKPINVIWRSK